MFCKYCWREKKGKTRQKNHRIGENVKCSSRNLIYERTHVTVNFFLYYFDYYCMRLKNFQWKMHEKSIDSYSLNLLIQPSNNFVYWRKKRNIRIQFRFIKLKAISRLQLKKNNVKIFSSNLTWKWITFLRFGKFAWQSKLWIPFEIIAIFWQTLPKIPKGIGLKMNRFLLVNKFNIYVVKCFRNYLRQNVIEVAFSSEESRIHWINIYLSRKIKYLL